MPQDMTAIQGRDRNEVEDPQHYIDQHKLEHQLAKGDEERIGVRKRGALEYSEHDLSTHRRDKFHKRQNEYGATGHHKVADRPHDLGENVVQHGVLEISRI